MRRLCLVLLAAALLAGPVLAQGDTTLRIHYHRFDANYAGWGIHLWNAVQWEGGGVFYIDGVRYDWNNPLPPTGTDDWGVYWDIPILYPDQELGFIIHNGGTKDPGPDQFWSDYAGSPEIWILSGFTQIFTSEPNPDVRLMSAVSNGDRSVTLALARDAAQLDAFHVLREGLEVAVTSRTATTPRTVVLTLQDPVDIRALYTVADDVGGNAVAVLHQFDDQAYHYQGDDLGFTYAPGSTTFKLWSPVASSASVLIYDNPQPVGGEPVERHLMSPDAAPGVLAVTVAGDHKDRYYLYEMTVYGETYTTPDLYSVALSANSARSQIVDLAETDPPGWDQDAHPAFPELASVIWEVHVRDLTASPDWNGTPANRGRFLGVVESGTSHDGRPSGFDHIVDLGVNTVQILPMYDFSSVDETDPASRNWGYDPYAYNVPEGSYSSNPDDGKVRIAEMKRMIQGFHDAGIKVVMDVVYNHTHNVGPQGSLYDAMVPKYYYRLLADGSYSNGSGVGNEVRTEALMAREFIKQSCRYWVEEFHVDGFRFDLMGLMDTDIMAEITAEVKAINPHAIIYGEPWGGYGTVPLTGKGDQRGLGFGCFNDNIRNAIRGSTDGTDGGFAMGDANDRAAVMVGLAGAIADFTDGPTETINYISAHDNYTWWDKLDWRWNPNSTPPPHYGQDVLRAMDRFGLSMVLTAQGIPFLHAGSEFLRTKRTGDPGQDEETIRNSYAAGDDVNQLDWARRVANDAIVEYVKGLVELRRARPEFRLGTADSILARQHFLAGLPTSAIAYTLDDVSPDDGWGDLLVVHNAAAAAVTVDLPAGHWVQVVDGTRAGTAALATHVAPAAGGAQLSVAGRSTAVLYREDVPALQLNLFQNPSLDGYLHLAVNSREGATSVTVTINGSDVPVTSLAAGTWFGSHHLTAPGDYEITVAAGVDVLVRRLTAWPVAAGGEAATRDGRARLLLPAAKADGAWIVALDREGRPELGPQAWAFGAADAVLPGARLRVLAGPDGGVLERRSGDGWTALPTTDLGDGWVEAPTDALGEFRLVPGTALPAATRLLGNAPNPFNPATEIRFAVAAADDGAPFTLAVHDLRGRLVRTLHSGPLAAGPHAVLWDGTARDGARAASGVYFYRLSTAGRSLVGRMLLLK